MTIRTGFSRAIILLAILSLCVAQASAKSDIGLKGIGLKVGYLMPEDPLDATITFGAVADLGTFIPELHWDASVQYWSTGYDESSWDRSWSDIAIKSTVRYLFPVQGNIKPYAGGGLGIHFYHSEWDVPSGYQTWGVSTSTSDTEFGIHVLGGAQFALAPKWKLQTELEYCSADLDQFTIGANIIYILGK